MKKKETGMEKGGKALGLHRFLVWAGGLAKLETLALDGKIASVGAAQRFTGYLYNPGGHL